MALSSSISCCRSLAACIFSPLERPAPLYDELCGLECVLDEACPSNPTDTLPTAFVGATPLARPWLTKASF